MTDVIAPARLSRENGAGDGSATPPVRIVHLGLGAFHRAHQAWYTAHATDAAAWGIVAFTGRSHDLADRLGPQDGLYTLVERGAVGDGVEVVSSIVRVAPGSDVGAFVAALADPDVAILTLTITEAGYRLTADGRLDADDPGVAADIRLLRDGITSLSAPITALGRIVVALDARRRAGAPPLAIVPCDNVPDNGRMVAGALRAFAELAAPEVAAWLADGIRVVSTSVDRITPRVDVAELAALRSASGWVDEAPVVTEPFSDWVLCGEFPSGRPDWAAAGARFVDDIEPWENRKLWMLNGAHTLIALLGGLLGHTMVAEAIGDPLVRAAVERLWDEDARHLPDLGLASYRDALIERFGNPRIEHRLDQIREDSLTKLRLRIVPVAVRERESGHRAEGAASVIAAWIGSIAAGQTPGPRGLDTAGLVALVDSRLGRDAVFCAEVESALTFFTDRPAFSPERPERMEHR